MLATQLPSVEREPVTALTALILGSLLGYRLTSQRRAFLVTTGGVLLVLVPQTILLQAGGQDVATWSYPVVQMAVIGLAWLTTMAGARLRARRLERTPRTSPTSR
jgi:uncharacterized membrane protein YedE/YeeE